MDDILLRAIQELTQDSYFSEMVDTELSELIDNIPMYGDEVNVSVTGQAVSEGGIIDEPMDSA